MRVFLSRPRFEIELGLPAFRGNKDVLLSRGKDAAKIKLWHTLAFIEGMADVPRGWKPEHDENGYQIMRDSKA